MTDIVFDGGPYDGRRGTVTSLSRVVNVAYVKPVQLPVPPGRPERPPWWRHPARYARWRRWTPPPASPLDFEPPKFQQLAYRDTGQVRDGAHVYAIGDWPWFKGPQVSGGDDLPRALAAACYAVPPRVRQDTRTRWVMDLGWYKRIRATAMASGKDDPDGEDPEKWKPDPEDQLMGIRIDVQADGGAPHLENRRYPADYP